MSSKMKQLQLFATFKNRTLFQLTSMSFKFSKFSCKIIFEACLLFAIHLIYDKHFSKICSHVKDFKTNSRLDLV